MNYCMYLLLNRVLLNPLLLPLLFLLIICDLMDPAEAVVEVMGGLMKSGALGFNLEVGGCMLYLDCSKDFWKSTVGGLVEVWGGKATDKSSLKLDPLKNPTEAIWAAALMIFSGLTMKGRPPPPPAFAEPEEAGRP